MGPMPPGSTSAAVAVLGVAAIALSSAAAAGAPKPPGASYPWAAAQCKFGRAGGADCVNPSDRTDRYDWGLVGRTGFRPYDAWGYEYRNCTSYAAWRLSRDGKSHFSLLGDASDWPAAARARASVGVTRNHIASVGAAAVWVARNHVAYVESTKGGVTISDFNARGTGKYWPRHPITAYDGKPPDWYIHFP